jgi:S1-C subfamily serine protease
VEGGEAIVLTNRHVVDPRFKPNSSDDGKTGGEVTVLLLAGFPQTGRVIWMAPDGIDAALVRLPFVSARAGPARWDGTRPRVGDPVFAIGNPQGLAWTHTQGTISQYRIQNINGHRLRVIQTHAAINPGNSGGGLYDQNGSLIGINTWIQDHRLSEGLGFAISTDSLAELFPPELGLRPH